MIIDRNITPLLTTTSTFILRPLNFNLTSLPRKDKNNTRHLESQWIKLLHLHTKYLRFTVYQADLYLFSRCLIVLFYHVGVQCWNRQLHTFCYLLALHQIIIVPKSK